MPFFSKFLAGGSKLFRWCQERRRRLSFPKSKQLRDRSAAKTATSRADVLPTRRKNVQSVPPSSDLGTQGRRGPASPALLGSNLVPLTNISHQVEPKLAGPESNILAATHPSAISSTKDITNSLPPTQLTRPNLPVPVFPIPKASALNKLYFETTNPSFRGFIKEPDYGKPTFGGGFSDVYRTPVQFFTHSEALPIEVAVKVPRAVWLGPAEVEQRLEQRFWQEAITWLMLPSHPNIVPLIGWTLEPHFSFIYPWYKRGNLSNHLKHLSNTQQLRILIGIAKALECLHGRDPPVAHGDIKPDNILLSDSGEPMLADFGLSTILGEETMYTSSHHRGGSMPWMSPECMMEGLKSCQSDVYSFGSLAFAVMTGELPYAGLAYGKISVKVCNTNNPDGPVGDWDTYPQLQGPIKDLLLDCWSPSPAARPSMSAVVRRLTAVLEPLGLSHPLLL